MADDKKVLSYLGLARRAGKTASGEFQTEESLKKEKARLVIIASDASDNTKKKFGNMCAWHHVRMVIFSDKATLGSCIGCGSRSSIALTDPGLADAVAKALGQETDTERRY